MHTLASDYSVKVLNCFSLSR